MITTLIATLLRLALITITAFAIIVLIEHGPAKFLQGARHEAAALADFVGNLGKSPHPAPRTPHPAGTPLRQIRRRQNLWLLNPRR